MRGFQRLDYSQRELVKTRLAEETQGSNGYFFLLFLAVVISTLGLLINSPAVIIGAMVVSPLLYPIITTGAAVVTGDHKLLRKAVLLVLRSTFIVVVSSFLITVLSPIKDETYEILARTQPTLIDLIIALAAGAAGAYAAVARKRFAAFTGVVISTAIVPPLAIVGYGFATAQYELVMGAFLLYSANLISVIVATTGVFYMLGFRAGRNPDKQAEATRDIAISLVLLVMIMSVLSYFLYSTIDYARHEQIVENEVKLFLKSYDDTQLISIVEKENPDQKLIKLTLQGPSRFTQKAVDLLDERLEKRLGEPINLQVLHSPMTKLIDYDVISKVTEAP